MRKLFSLLLCLILAMFMLVSCDEGEIGDIPEYYPEPEEGIQDVSVNMYIIAEDATSSNAIDTVSRMIAQYTLATYHTEVNVKYLSAAEYDQKVLAAVSATDASAANIVLVNSVELMNSLVGTQKMLNLADYFVADEFGTLNVTIPETLINASLIGEGELYSVPNNHIIGEYEYLVINEEIAKQILKVNATTLSSYTTYESTEELRAEMERAGYDSSKYVRVERGAYSLKAELEASGNACNVISKPKATVEEAFSAAFAIVDKGELYNYRCMQIVYALSNDAELRNLLQYGVNGTNYTLSSDGEIIMATDADNVYRMNLEYTGNVFIAGYCDEIAWTAEKAASGIKQNAESVQG